MSYGQSNMSMGVTLHGDVENMVMKNELLVRMIKNNITV